MELMDEQESPSADRPLNTITVAGRELLLVEVGGGTEIHLASEFAEGDTAIQIDGIPGDDEDPTLGEQTTWCARPWQGVGAGADGPTVLRDVSFSAPAGSTVAVVGRTGAGKSTLVSFLPRIFDPPPGTVFVDGVPVEQLPLGELRRSIGMVPQESFLFSTSVRENVAFGRPDADDDEVAEAARLAGLSEDLEGFPRGLETLVGERGITLSGGQKQRVALARAILRRPRILILDDSLSAVDTQTEETILGNLRSVFEERTVFLISHRISTVHRADLILVLEDGRVAERGTHAELLAAGGLYAELAERQRLEEELEAV